MMVHVNKKKRLYIEELNYILRDKVCNYYTHKM